MTSVEYCPGILAFNAEPPAGYHLITPDQLISSIKRSRYVKSAICDDRLLQVPDDADALFFATLKAKATGPLKG